MEGWPSLTSGYVHMQGKLSFIVNNHYHMIFSIIINSLSVRLLTSDNDIAHFLCLFVNYKCLAVLPFIQTHAFSVLTSAFGAN